MGLAAAAGDLVVEVGMIGDEHSDDLVCDQILPICAGNVVAVAKHRPRLGEVGFGIVEEFPDLWNVSTMAHMRRWNVQHTEWCLRASTVSVAEPTISAMGGLEPPAPAPLAWADASVPRGPLEWPFIWRGGGESGGGKGADALFTALYLLDSSRISDAKGRRVCEACV